MPAVAWPAVLGAVGAALTVTATLGVLPPIGDGLIPVLAVLVLACGVAAAAEDGTAALTVTTPVAPRRRLVARALLVVPLAAAGMIGVLGVAALAGAAPDQDLVLLWAALSTVALAVGVVARRTAAEVPGPAAAAVILLTGYVLVTRLPSWVLDMPVWDSWAERIGILVVLSAVLLARATRDPAAS
ncbi:hypothetical protein ACI78T_12890 [Blastococcus sp. SYSU D00922]